MKDSQKTWDNISAIVDDIARTQAEMSPADLAVMRDPTDREALKIIKRIERKLLAKGIKRS